MIIDYNKQGSRAYRYSIFSARTGECLDSECISYADDEAGYYLRHIGGRNGKYVWDARTKERIRDRVHRESVPGEFLEVAWERVDRPIVIRPRDGGPRVA